MRKNSYFFPIRLRFLIATTLAPRTITINPRRIFFQSYKKKILFLGDAEEVEGDESPEPEGEGGEQEEEEQVSNYILLS